MNEEFRGDGVQNALTCIHTRIHSVAATDEVAQAQIEAFLDAIADIAMKIAQRDIEATSEPV
jgi:hypothetical protein